MCQWLYDVIVTSLKWAIWLQLARPASNGPFNFKRAIHPRMARSGSSLPFDRLQWSSASRQLYRAHWRRTLPRGPSLNSPMPIRCLRGVAAFSSFPKPLFQFPFSECLPFRNSPSRCNIVAVLAVALTYSRRAICEPVPQPQDNPGCWNSCSNVTSFAPWSASITPDMSRFWQKTQRTRNSTNSLGNHFIHCPTEPPGLGTVPVHLLILLVQRDKHRCPLSHPVCRSTKDSKTGQDPWTFRYISKKMLQAMNKHKLKDNITFQKIRSRKVRTESTEERNERSRNRIWRSSLFNCTFRVQLQSTLNKEMYLASFDHSGPECLGSTNLAPRIDQNV